MKTPLSILAATILALSSLNANEAEPISWQNNFNTALESCYKNQKPLVILFTCPTQNAWCERIENEVFNSQEFISRTREKFSFTKVDTSSEENQALAKAYDVRSYPTLILTDERGQRIATAGYRPGGGALYADYLFKTLNEYRSYQNELEKIGHGLLSSLELQYLYIKAKELHQEDDLPLISKIGLATSENHFFLKERYHQLLKEGQDKESETVALRKKLCELDPDNNKKIHYDLDVLDFELNSAKAKARNLNSDEVCEPLIKYIEGIGSADNENLWRLHMIVSQTYLKANNKQKALAHAERCRNTAPEMMKTVISKAIESMKESKSL